MRLGNPNFLKVSKSSYQRKQFKSRPIVDFIAIGSVDGRIKFLQILVC